jgi:hypothetical protein
MTTDHALPGDWNAFLKDLAAELTNAAYPVVLQHGVGEKWLDVELDLWKAMTESVKKLDRGSLHSLSKLPNAPRASEFFG